VPAAADNAAAAMPPPLSIIVPVLDEAAGIEACLRALAPHRAAGAEVIVVDGGSRDGTVERARPLADRLLAGEPGRARQMNLGAAQAAGDTLLFLHADTTLPPRAPALIATALAGGTSAWGRFDVHIVGRSALLPMVAALMTLRSRLTGIATGDQAIFVRHSAFDAIGGFPEQPLMEDVEISRRLKRRFGRPACLRACVRTSGRRWDGRGPWRTIFLMWRLRFLYWRGTSPERLARLYR
jgi:rSAM/selenodomain-associated transferase 2